MTFKTGRRELYLERKGGGKKILHDNPTKFLDKWRTAKSEGTLKKRRGMKGLGQTSNRPGKSPPGRGIPYRKGEKETIIKRNSFK